MKTNLKQVIKSAIATRSYTQDATAKKAGWKGQTALSTAINRDNPSLETIIRILDALEYDLVIKDRNGSNCFTINKEEE